jgi:hypothetical protein
LQNLRPPLLDPAVDGSLVTFDSTTHRVLYAPTQAVAQQRPHPGRVVADPGQPLDDGGDALQRPQLPGEPVGARTLQQSLLDPVELAVGQPGRRPGRALAVQADGAGDLPTPIPQMHALAGDADLAGDLSLADAGSEQLGGPQPTGLEPLAFLLRRGAASNGWHGPILTGRAPRAQLRPCQTNTQNQLPRRKLDTGLAGGRLPRSGAVRISSYFRSL